LTDDDATRLSDSIVELVPSLQQSFASIVEACDLYDRLSNSPTTAEWPLPKAKARLQDTDSSLDERRRALAALSLNPRPHAGTLLNWWADDDPGAGSLAHFALVARLEWERRFDPQGLDRSSDEDPLCEPTW
jgi:hypothetical protein